MRAGHVPALIYMEVITLKFLESNKALYRLLRTVLQGVIGVLIANLDVITGAFQLPDVWKPIIAALVMAILSPIMAALGGKTEDE